MPRIRVNPIFIRLVVLFVAGVVYHESIIQHWRMTNNNTINCVSQVFWVLLITIPFVIEVTQGKDKDPSAFIMANHTDKEKWWDEATWVCARDAIHHAGSMCDCIEPECMWHLLPHQVSTTHVNHCLSVRLDQPIQWLAFCWSCNNFWICFNKVLADSCAKEFEVAFQVKAFGRPGWGTEKSKSWEDTVQGKSFKSKYPAILGHAIDKDESIMEITHWKKIVKCNVHVNGIQVFIPGAIKCATPFSFRNSCKGTKQWEKFATVGLFVFTTDQENVFIVPEFSTTHNPVQFLCQPMCFPIWLVGCATRINHQKCGIRMMNKACHLFQCHNERSLGWVAQSSDKAVAGEWAGEGGRIDGRD